MRRSLEPVSDLLVAVLSWVAQRERERIKERVKAGLANARRQGKKLGRPKKRDDGRIRELRGQGMSIRQVALAVGLSTTAVQRALVY